MPYKLNVTRKIFHLLGIVIPIVFFFQVFDLLPIEWFADNTRSILFYTLAFVSFFLIIIEILRFRFSFFQKLFVRVAGSLLKQQEQEQNKVNGSIGYMLGNTILLAFFPKEIAILAILFLLFGDPAAAFIGSKYGNIRIWHGRSLEGSITGVLTGIFVGFAFITLLTVFHEGLPTFYLWNHSGFNYKVLLILLSGASFAFFLEAISTQGIFDDNFLMPVGSAFMMVLIARIQDIEVNLYPLHKLIFPIVD